MVVDGHVDLDHPLDRPSRLLGSLAPQGTDDPGGQRLIWSKRVANGEDTLADLQIVGSLTIPVKPR